MEPKRRIKWSPVLVDGASHAKTDVFTISLHRKAYGWTLKIVHTEDQSTRLDPAKKAAFREFMKYDYEDPFTAAQDWCERFLLGDEKA